MGPIEDRRDPARGRGARGATGALPDRAIDVRAGCLRRVRPHHRAARRAHHRTSRQRHGRRADPGLRPAPLDPRSRDAAADHDNRSADQQCLDQHRHHYGDDSEEPTRIAEPGAVISRNVSGPDRDLAAVTCTGAVACTSPGCPGPSPRPSTPASPIPNCSTTTNTAYPPPDRPTNATAGSAPNNAPVTPSATLN